MDFRDFINEAKMTDDECLDAAKSILKNGDDKAKEFAQGLIDYYKENESFHPNQIAGLQNIMKNASFQMAEDEINEGSVTAIISSEKLLRHGFKKKGKMYDNGNGVAFYENECDVELKGRTTRRKSGAYQLQSNVEPVSILVMPEWIDIK